LEVAVLSVFWQSFMDGHWWRKWLGSSVADQRNKLNSNLPSSHSHLHYLQPLHSQYR
jgi:hypothetical protein